MIKIKSALTKKNPIGSLKETYEKIYQDDTIWKFSKFDGVHAIIWSLLKDKLKNSFILDVGCGTGRLSFYLGITAKRVLGIDFSYKAIEKAVFLKKFLSIKSVDFRVDKLENITEKFNIIVFADIIEHVEDPLSILKHSYKILGDHGIVVISCPGFMNLRGLIYETLLHALSLPMSLADVRQVDYLMVHNWAKATNFKLVKIVGGLYNLAWGEVAIKDLIERLPKVFKDKPVKEVNLSAFNKWLKHEKILYKDFYNYLQNKHLKKLRNLPKLKFSIPHRLKDYLVEGFKRDPYYSEEYPFNLWGGETIYLLKKM